MDSVVAFVAVENTVYHFDRKYSYLVPPRFSYLEKGARVAVPFGKGDRKRQGIVLSIEKTSSDIDDLKEISDVLDNEPVLTDEMIELCEFIKSRCFCTYYDAVNAMLPAGIHYQLCWEYSVSDTLGDRIYDLSDEWKRIVKIILSKNNCIKQKELLKECGYQDDSLLRLMVNDGVLERKSSATRKLSDKTVRMLRLVDRDDASDFDVKLTQKQRSVVDLLSAVSSASVKEICYYTGVSVFVADSLVKKGVAEYFDDEVFRIPKTLVSERREITLTDEQNKAFEELSALCDSQNSEVSLLYGVTGSGKTSVFFKLIQRVVADGRGVIVMVPEISLTPQLISLFKGEFGDSVAVFHSALSLGERLDEYKRVKKGIAKIAVGTRSAVFAPLSDIGLIIMDEEQEHTYKSESRPRFHAKELALFRASYHKCLLLLSSATPSVETFYACETGRYHRSTIRSRYGSAVLPDVIIADMNEESYVGNTGELSNVLLDELEYNLDHSRQSILLLNRRGYNTFVTCSSCRETVSCPNCSISLTYHNANNRMICHYCGYSSPRLSKCPTCQSEKLRYSGAGTQRAESELAEIFPDARILRMDADSTMTRSSHEKKLSAFSNGEYDILVGTQMVAKGLDFPNVTLVGVINADRMLYLDDYRSYENTFSLLTQVVGRSGRGREKGRAVIQTYTPENPIISLAARQDYDAFYRSEIEIRRSLLYPPFVSMCLVGFVSENAMKSFNASRAFTDEMTTLLKQSYPDIPLRILGPAPASVFKTAGKYRYKILLKCRNDSRFREMLSSMLVSFSKKREFSDVTVYADMHPIDL